METPAHPQQFQFACWSLTEQGNPEPLRKELERLAKTSIGERIIKAQELLDDHDNVDDK
jgi:hypothetical protein